ncbi:hypothetical protein GN956_G15223 [Arapaima gigas]
MPTFVSEAREPHAGEKNRASPPFLSCSTAFLCDPGLEDNSRHKMLRRTSACDVARGRWGFRGVEEAEDEEDEEEEEGGGEPDAFGPPSAALGNYQSWIFAELRELGEF